MKRLLLLLVLIIIAAIDLGCARFAYVENQFGYNNLRQPYVRVRIMETSAVSISCSGPYELFCTLPTGEKTDYYSNSEVRAFLRDGRIAVDERSGLPLESGLKGVVAVPASAEDHLILDGKAFRGVADIILESDSLSVVNAVYMEDYLKGVLPPEIGKHGRSELEALKAQAVASRTYALSRFKRNPGRAYDMVNQVADQLYIGMSIEDKWINRAIEQTRGEVLMVGGDLITAYYHSTCGGATENIEDVWEKQARSYLKGKDDGHFCSWSKFYDWEYRWNASNLARFIETYLRNKGRFNGDSLLLDSLKVIDRLPSGRIRILKVFGRGMEFLLFKDQIRWALLRPDKPGAILPSTLFELFMERDANGRLSAVTAKGHGNGHGVGMCQCGALGRSRAGAHYREILKHYYSNIDIKSVY